MNETNVNGFLFVATLEASQMNAQWIFCIIYQRLMTNW